MAQASSRFVPLEPMSSAAATATAAGRRAAIRRRILVVEDSPGDAELTLERLAVATGPAFDVACAATLAEAVDVLGRHRVDSVILDLNLPDSQGVDTLRRIKSVVEGTPVIVLTGQIDDHLRQNAIDSGADEVFEKDEANTRLFWRAVMQIIDRQREHQRHLQALLDSTPDAILVVNEDGRVRYVNHEALALFARSREDLLGEPLGFSVRDGEPVEIVIPRADGERICEMRVLPFIWDDERTYVASIRDITVRRQAEALRERADALERENARIVEASRIKGQFLANMSHELRTPLNAIIGFSELMAESRFGIAPQRQGVFAGHILASGKHLLQLINDLLDLTKVEAGRISLRPEAVRLPDLVDEVVAVLGSLALRKRARVAVDHDPALGEVVIDPIRFKQVLYNYLSNALKFVSEGGHVLVRTHLHGDAAFRVEVEDDGAGIASADLGRLFREFEQLDAGAATQQAGTGLGLALTKRMVEAQGGTVGVSSVVGRGSVFHAVLPLRAAVRERPGA